MSGFSERKWLMFLPLILVIGGILFVAVEYGIPSPAVNPDIKPQLRQTEMDETPLPHGKDSPQTMPPDILVVDAGHTADIPYLLRQYGFWHEERLLQLLSHRPANPEKDDEFHCPVNPEILRQRQEFWLKSGVNSIVHQRQMLKDDPVMQYLALDMIIDLFRKTGNPDKKSLERWIHLVNIQRKILSGIR